MECLKQSSPSVFICPENEYFTNNHTNAVQVTYRLQKVEKELRKRRNRRLKGEKLRIIYGRRRKKKIADKTRTGENTKKLKIRKEKKWKKKQKKKEKYENKDEEKEKGKKKRKKKRKKRRGNKRKDEEKGIKKI